MVEPLTDETLDKAAELFRYGTNYIVAKQLVAHIRELQADNARLREAMLAVVTDAKTAHGGETYVQAETIENCRKALKVKDAEPAEVT